jgi:hypothetical protein
MAVGNMQPLWAMAVARRLPAAVGILQPTWAMTFAELPWPTTVGPKIAVGDEGRRGPRRLVVKTVKFWNHRIILQND